MTDTLGLITGLVLTLFVYSYLVGDNPLYRVAVHMLVGVSAAYATVIATNRILIPVLSRLLVDPAAPDNIAWLIPVSLSVLLLLKSVRGLSWFGNTPVGFLVTVGAAVALVGAVTGTVIPQLTAFRNESTLNLLLVTLLTICVVLYFQFSSRGDEQNGIQTGAGTRSVRTVGHAILMVTFGAVFAGIFTTSLILLVERLTYFITGLTTIIGLILT